MQSKQPCIIDGCGRRRLSHGWCPAHYWRWKKYGTPQAERPIGARKVKESCKVTGCEGKHSARGMCARHYWAWNTERTMVEVTCRDCGKVWKRQRSAMPAWQGRCLECAMKEVAHRPEVRAQRSQRAREQVKRMGGIPNGHRFTAENWSGPLNNNWKGGIPIRGVAYPNYSVWRKAVFERDGYTCQRCGQVGGSLVAHHIQPVRTHRELTVVVSNGQTLCQDCHWEIDPYAIIKGRKRITAQ